MKLLFLPGLSLSEHLALLSLIVGIVLYVGTTVVVFFRGRAARRWDPTKELESLQIPKTGAERYKALKSDPNMLDRIKRAAFLRVHRPPEPFIERSLLRAGLVDSAQRRRFGIGSLLLLLLVLLSGWLVTFDLERPVRLWLQAILVVVTAITVTSHLNSKIRSLAVRINAELPLFIQQLLMAVLSAESIDRTLRIIVAVGRSRGYQGPLLTLVEEALAESHDHASFIKALRRAATTFDHPHLYSVLSLLLQVEHGRSEVVTQMLDILRTVERELSVSEEHKQLFFYFSPIAYLQYVQMYGLPWGRIWLVTLLAILLLAMLSAMAGVCIQLLPIVLAVPLVSFEATLHFLRQQLISESNEFLFFVGHFAAFLKEHDIITAFQKSADYVPHGSTIAIEIEEMFTHLRQHRDEQRALREFARDVPLYEVHLFVDGLIVSRMYPARVSLLLEHTLLRTRLSR